MLCAFCNPNTHCHFTFRWKKQFKQLLEDTGYVTPGKALSEVRVLFMGRECFEALSEMDCQHIYDQHQKEIIEKAKHNFQVGCVLSTVCFQTSIYCRSLLGVAIL